MPFAARFEDGVIALARGVAPPCVLSRFAEIVAVKVAFVPAFARSAMPVLCMKIGSFGGDGGKLYPVDVPVQIRDRLGASFVSVMRPRVANGIGKYAFSALSEATASSAE